jgi:hypothetical protein
MTKAEIIKQEIITSIVVPDIQYDQDMANLQIRGYKVSGATSIAIVDIDKLANLLAKYLDIKIDGEEKPVKLKEIVYKPHNNGTTNNKMPEKVEILSQ